MSRIILTANINNIDRIYDVPDQKFPADYFCYTEKNLPYPLPNLNPRMQSKFVKICSHTFLPHEEFIYMDGRIQVISEYFTQFMSEKLEGYDVAIFPHENRKTIGEELEYILRKMEQGSQYLLSRYADQQLEKELDFYKSKGAENLPLFHCNLFVRKNNMKVNDAFNHWWFGTTTFSCFDQCYYSFAMQNLKVNVLDLKDRSKLVNIHRHK